MTLLAAAILLTACGNKLPESSADKAVTAYAQLYSCGEIDDELRPAVNLTDADIAEARKKFVAPVLQALQKYPLTEETLQGITKKFFDRMKNIMDITATLTKNGDANHPVVELVTTNANVEILKIFAEDDDDLIAFRSEFARLKAQGVTDDELKQNPEFQKQALEAIGNFFGDLTLNAEATILVPCVIVTGADGKLYWQPENVDAIAKYIAGQK